MIAEICGTTPDASVLRTEERHAEDVRKELLIEIERERARAHERAAEQRKHLDLEIDEDDTGPN